MSLFSKYIVNYPARYRPETFPGLRETHARRAHLSPLAQVFYLLLLLSERYAFLCMRQPCNFFVSLFLVSLDLNYYSEDCFYFKVRWLSIPGFQRREGKRWRTIFLCGQQKENNISRIRSCLLHVWLVELSDFLLQFRLFFQKKQLLRALHEFLKY